MKHPIEYQVEKLMNGHLRSGSKKARKEEVSKIKRFCQWVVIANPGVQKIENIGRKHVYLFYTNITDRGRSPSTIYKYALAIEKMWFASGKSGVPPKF
jgi:hypothetical protein